jgi:small multidrug resistance pump
MPNKYGDQMGYLYLAIAIVSEVIGTSALKATDGFTKLIPSAIVVVGYGAAFYFLSLVLKSIPVGVAYAIWAGLGIVLVALVAAVIFKQVPDVPAIIGMVLIVSGVVVINVFSKTVIH